MIKLEKRLTESEKNLNIFKLKREERDVLLLSILKTFNNEDQNEQVFVKSGTGNGLDLISKYDFDDDYDGYDCEYDCDCDSCNSSFVMIDKKNIKEKHIPSDLTYGLEIECGINRKTMELYHSNKKENNVLDIKTLLSKENIKKSRKIKTSIQTNLAKERIAKNFKFSSDGSIEQYGAITNSSFLCEIKSQIFSGDNGLEEIKYLFNKLKPKFNATCGIHIHIGRTETIVQKINKLAPIIDHIVAPNFQTRTRHYNTFCIPCKTRLDGTIPRVLNDSALHYHYSATSISNSHPTIEFRHLAGTKDLVKVFDFLKILTNLLTVKNNNFNKENIDASIRRIVTLDGKLTNCISNFEKYTEKNKQKQQAFEIAKDLIFNY